MRARIGLLVLCFSFYLQLNAQELYVFAEPASNMPAKSIGVRLTNEGLLSSDFRNRSIAEVMVGLNKNIMFHAQGFFSDMDGKYKAEGASLYVKYRFLSLDDAQSHFRAAAFGRVSSSNRNMLSEDINLEGDNAGVQGGLIFTQLLHKLALSATVAYNKSFNNEKALYAQVIPDFHGFVPMMQSTFPSEMISYSLSSGYLLLPFVYKNYKQPNFNLYFEVLGKTNPANGRSYIDFAPAVQVILNSKTRIDLGYRFQASGNMPDRYLKNMYLARLELNFFNALSKKTVN
ncbi:MAG: hypothetical protein EOO90_01480 [Pedobacter sp.]|nr:MAG: hypothetical protein EOO90_01480 [Pedobacter sp.]